MINNVGEELDGLRPPRPSSSRRRHSTVDRHKISRLDAQLPLGRFELPLKDLDGTNRKMVRRRLLRSRGADPRVPRSFRLLLRLLLLGIPGVRVPQFIGLLLPLR